MAVDNENINTESLSEILEETTTQAAQPEESKRTYNKQEKTDKPYWYVVYTYSGYENKVMTNLLKTVENNGLHDNILDVKVPMEETIEIKNGKRKVVDRKIFQGYVLVEMSLSDETWYIVRNTPGVTGFVGNGTQPTPVSEKEIAKIKKRMGVEDPKYSVNYEINEVVSIIDGPFKGFEGTISEIDTQKGKLKVMVSMFGRETPVELDALQVKQL